MRIGSDNHKANSTNPIFAAREIADLVSTRHFNSNTFYRGEENAPISELIYKIVIYIAIGDITLFSHYSSAIESSKSQYI